MVSTDRAIDVPYCHLLFELPVLERYVEDRGLPRIAFGDLNGWSVRRFRQLWETRDRLIARVRYREVPQVPRAGDELIVRYPSVFSL